MKPIIIPETQFFFGDTIAISLPRAGWRSPNPDEDATLLGQPDMSVFMGTNRNEPDYANSRAGFTRETDPIFGTGGTHQRAFSWYAGTSNLSIGSFPFPTAADDSTQPLFRRRGDGYIEELFDKEFSFDSAMDAPRVGPWYVPEHSEANFRHADESAPWEGIGTGWFYSALGGGFDLRPQTTVPRVPVDWDNTYDRDLRGDKAVPTLFNGNFDASFNLRDRIRKTVSKAIPGWSFHNDSTPLQSDKLVDLSKQNNTSPDLREHLRQVGKDPESVQNYALRLKAGDEATHNRFVVPEWGTLRFDLHVPNLSGGSLKVSLEGDNGRKIEETISLLEANGPYDLGYNDADTYKIGYGTKGFETFHVDVPDELRGQVATVKFEADSGTVYLDNVFFQSQHLLLGNPALNGKEARPNPVTHANNYLLEKPQYSLSYNESNLGPNWVSWQLNKTWLGDIRAPEREQDRDINDPFPWHSDPEIVDRLETTEGQSYGNLGLDRGHMTAREQRNRTQKDQFATFLTTNVLPQNEATNRRGAWRQLEQFSRRIVKERGWELYNIAGGFGSDNDAYAPDAYLNIEGINIPEFTWKTLVILEPGQGLQDVNDNTPVIAVTFPNFPFPGRWFDAQHLTTVNRIEALTGLDLLSNLPDELEERLESREYNGPFLAEDFPQV